MPTQGGTVRWIIEADDSQFNQTLDNVEQRAETTVKVLKRNDVGGSFWSSISDGAKSSASALGNLASSVASVGWSVFNVGATAAVTSLTALVNKGLQATDFLETSRVAMAGLAGSVAAGNKAMSIAANYWQNNPFQRIDVTSATKQLVQFGRNTNQLSDDLEILGNVSLSSGVNISELARYYARVSASGRAMTQDLEMMSDRGVPIYRELAKQLKTTTQGVRDMASAGKIGFEEFRKAMEKSVNKEAMDSYDKTLARQVDKYKGSLQILASFLAGYSIDDKTKQLVIAADGLYTAWTKTIGSLAQALRNSGLQESLGKLGKLIAQVLDKVLQFYTTYDSKGKEITRSKTFDKLADILGKIVNFLAENKALLLGVMGAATVFVGNLASKLPGIGPVVTQLLGPVKGLANSFMALFKTHPLIAIFVSLFTAGLASAFKNSEKFRNSISSLFSSLGKIVQNLVPIFQTFAGIIADFVSSKEFIGLIELLANVLASVAEAISNIPIEVLTSLVTTLLMFKLLDTKPILGYAAALLWIITVIKKFGPTMLKGIKDAFENIGKTLEAVGNNIMVGLQNGINEGAKRVFEFVRTVALTIVGVFKKTLGIHSPSKVMAEQGRNITLGLANGITDSKSVVQKAMDDLASDVLKAIEKVVSNKVDFGLLDYAGQYKEWKKISKMFTAGSQQYQTAIEKMEEARKQANLQILSLQKTYNDTLDDTIEKLSKMYGLFDKVDTSGGKNANDIISDLDQQVAALQNFASSKEMINALDLDKGLIDELQSMGIDSAQELATIAQMTTDELAKLNDLWLKKQEQANRAGVAEVKNLKDKTLDEVAKIKDGIDGETISLTDAGGRLVESISEGVYGAMPTLQEAFSKMDEYMAKAARQLGKNGTGGGAGGVTPENIENPIKNNLDKAANDLKKFAEDFGAKMMTYIGIGLVGGIALKAVTKGLTSFFAKKVFNGGGAQLIMSGVKNIGMAKDAGKVAKDAADAAKDAGNIAKSTQTVSGKLETVSTEMTKGQKMMKTIREGAYTIITIAAAIAAMAVAIRVAYEALKEVDWAGFASSMGMVATAVVAMSVVAKISDKLGTNWKGVAVIIGLAVDLAVMAVAIRVAYEALRPVDWAAFGTIIGEVAAMIGALGVLAGVIGKFPKEVALGMVIILGLAVDLAAMGVSIRLAYEALKPVNWPEFGKIIGQVSATIGALGVLAGVIGAFAAPVALGMVIILGLCVDLIAMAASIRLSYEALKPIGWDEYGKILGEVSATIGVMGVLAGVIGVFAPIVGAGVLAILGVAEAIRQIADALRVAYDAIPDDLNGLNSKMDLLKEQLGSLSMITGVIGLFMPLEEAGVIAILGIAEAVRQIAQSLFLIDIYVPNDLAKITAKVELVKYVIQKVAEADIGQVIGSIVANINVGIVTQVVDNYVVIAQSLQRLYYIELDANKVEKKVGLIQRVVTMVAESAGERGFFQQIADVVNTALNNNVVDNAASILRIYSTLGNSLNKIQNIDVNFAAVQNKVSEIQKIVQLIIDMKGDGGIFGKIGNFFTGNPINEEQVQKVVNILRKLGDIGSTINAIPGVYTDAAKEKIEAMKNVINKVGEIKDPGDLGTKEWVVGMAASIVYKLGEMENALRTLKGEDKTGVVKTLLNTMNTLLTGVVNNLQNKLGDLETLGKNMVIRFKAGLDSQKDGVSKSGADLQGALWNAIEKKMSDEYYQGRALANKIKEGVKSVSLTSAGQNAVQGFINGANSKNVYSTGWQIADRFLKGLKDRGKEGSPWQTTFESGTWAGLGLAEGIASSEALVVGEAYSLADQVIDALSMDDVSVSPSFNPAVGGSVPLMDMEGGYYGNKRPVEINQTNNNYTNYSMQALNRDLAWEISKI